MIFVRVMIATAKEEERKNDQGITEADSITEGRWETNGCMFVATIDKALSYAEGEMEKQPTAYAPSSYRMMQIGENARKTSR